MTEPNSASLLPFPFAPSPAENPAEVFAMPVPVAPPFQAQGEFSFAELLEQWKQAKASGVYPAGPIPLLDVAKLREAHQLRWERSFRILEEAPEKTEVVAEIPRLDVALDLSIDSRPEPISFVPDKPNEPTSIPAFQVPRISFELERVRPSSSTTHKGLTFLPSTSERPDLLLTLPSWKLPSIAWPEISLPSLQPNWFRLAGNFAFSAAVAVSILFGGPVVVLETQSLLAKARQSLQPAPQVVTLEEVTPSPSPEIRVASAEDVFSVSIPSLNISSRVIANVDATNQQDYSNALKEGIAHAQGSALPDQLEENKTIYLFAHSTDAPWNILRYNAQFYALKDAEVGAEIKLRFWGQDYAYQIEEIHIIEAEDTSFIQPQTEEEKLVLQTCFPPGTAEKRLVVIAKPILE